MMKRILLVLAIQCAAAAAASSSDDVCPVDNSAPVVPLDFFTTTDALGPFYVENVNAQVEAWYAGEAGYSDTENRGQLRTDDCGRFQFKQIFPALYPGRPIPHVHYRISSPDSEVLLVTQLYFEGAITQGYNPDQTKIASIVNEEDGSRSASFDIYVDVPGTADVNLAACDEESTADFLDEMGMAATMIPEDDETATISTVAPSELSTDNDNEINEDMDIVQGMPCGPNICAFPQECCNESCGVCVDPGGICTMRGCVNPLPQGSSPGGADVSVSTSKTVAEKSDLFD